MRNDGKKAIRLVWLPGGSIDLALSMNGTNLNLTARLKSATGQVLNKAWKLLAVDSSKILVINNKSVF